MKRLIYLCSVWPEPQSSAAGVRSLHLIQKLQQQSIDVILASHAKGEFPNVGAEFQKPECHSIELNRSSFDQWLENLHHDRPIDGVIFDRFVTEEQYGWRVARFPEITRIVDTQDLHSLRENRYRKLPHDPSIGWNAEVDSREWTRSEHTLRELGSILRSDATLVVSTVERDLLISILPQEYASKILYVPFPSSATREVQKLAKKNSDFRVGFYGNARHGPNEDAVRVLVEEVWPIFQKKWSVSKAADTPSVRLIIAGAYPPNIYQKYLKIKDVELAGPIPIDQWDGFVSGLSVLAAPLRFGAGIKGKILEALSRAVPVVTSPIGVEGLGGCWVVQSPEEMAEALHVLALEESTRVGLGNAGKIWYDQAYFPHTEAPWGELLKNAVASRTWYQSLLQMESLGREKYFSKWIECKETRENRSDG